MLGLPCYRRVAIVTCVLLVLFDGMEKSLGHINHSKFVMLYAAFVLAAFPSADAVSLSWRRSGPSPPILYAAPVIVISLLIIVPYSMLGAFRLGRSGPDFFFGDAIKHWFLKRSLEANATGFRFGIVVVESALLLALAKVGFAITSLLELLSPLCLVSRWFRWLWIPVMIGFHFTSLVTMNIFFWQNALLILLVMTGCDRRSAPHLSSGPAPTLFYTGERGARLARGVLACDSLAIVRTAPLRESLPGSAMAPHESCLVWVDDEESTRTAAEALERIARRLERASGGPLRWPCRTARSSSPSRAAARLFSAPGSVARWTPRLRARAGRVVASQSFELDHPRSSRFGGQSAPRNARAERPAEGHLDEVDARSLVAFDQAGTFVEKRDVPAD